MDAAKILVGRREQTVFIRIIGQAAFEHARYLRTLAHRLSEAGVTQWILDLQACAYLDSTFLGILVSLSKDLKNMPPMRIVNASEHHLRTFKDLALDRIFQIEPSPMPFADENFQAAELGPQDTRQQIAQTMLEAHETLSSLTPDNAVKFHDVVTYLRDTLGIKEL